MKKSVRLEDSGLITLEGYTAGSRTCSQFGWARNLKGQLDSQMIQSQRYRASSLFALLWNVISRAIPSEVIADLDTFLEANPIFRMDAGSEGKAAMRFSIQLGNHELDFFGSLLLLVLLATTTLVISTQRGHQTDMLSPGTIGETWVRSMGATSIMLDTVFG